MEIDNFVEKMIVISTYKTSGMSCAGNATSLENFASAPCSRVVILL